ncbi:MAG: murein L,D-transpeptidase family protein [Rhizobiaceae bacterium]
MCIAQSWWFELSASLLKNFSLKKVAKASVFGAALVSLSACNGALDGLEQKANAPVPKRLVTKMKAKGMTRTSPIMLRIFKQENTLEVWKRKDTGRYALLTSHEICKWSGKLGPKFKEGDRQAPEGFYNVNKHQMNPKSKYHLSFNMGFPNAYDRSHGRTGQHLMVHGACSSAGCYSMTDERVEVIYALARDAFKGGQKAFQIQAYPFRMTAKNMVKNRGNKNFKFWKMLKKGYDHFEITSVPPKVDVCGKRYEFNTESSARYPSSGHCPTRKMPTKLANAYVVKQNAYATSFEKLLAKAESRKAIALTPLTFTTALPGVTIEGPKPAPASTPKVAPITTATPTTTAAEPVATKPSPASDSLTTNLKPAG